MFDEVESSSGNPYIFDHAIKGGCAAVKNRDSKVKLRRKKKR
jgi:hypothetical protein